MTIYICKPDLGHLFQEFPKDFIHQLHKWSLGIVLIDHQEPHNQKAIDLHRSHVVLEIIVRKVRSDK